MRFIETDVLILGGGIAGCFAALGACKIANRVTLLEKSTVRRGGAVGPGMDQIMLGIGGPIPGAMRRRVASPISAASLTKTSSYTTQGTATIDSGTGRKSSQRSARTTGAITSRSSQRGSSSPST